MSATLLEYTGPSAGSVALPPESKQVAEQNRNWSANGIYNEWPLHQAHASQVSSYAIKPCHCLIVFTCQLRVSDRVREEPLTGIPKDAALANVAACSTISGSACGTMCDRSQLVFQIAKYIGGKDMQQTTKALMVYMLMSFGEGDRAAWVARVSKDEMSPICTK